MQELVKQQPYALLSFGFMSLLSLLLCHPSPTSLAPSLYGICFASPLMWALTQPAASPCPLHLCRHLIYPEGKVHSGSRNRTAPSTHSPCCSFSVTPTELKHLRKKKKGAHTTLARDQSARAGSLHHSKCQHTPGTLRLESGSSHTQRLLPKDTS